MSMHAFDLPAEDYVELNRIMGNDTIYFSHVWRVGRKERQDAEGRIHYIDGQIKQEADLKALWFPDLNDIERRLEALVRAAHDAGFGVIYGTQSAAFTSAVAMGFQDFCLAVVDRPAFVLDLQRRFQDYALQELEMALRFPIDAAKIGSGLVTKNGPMLSPEMMETFELTLLREQTRMIKDRGLPVLLHIDGFVEAMIPDFIEMGVDILNPIELCDGKQDIYRIKEQFGDRLTLCGNIDIDGVLLRGTPEEVADDVRRHIEALSPGGGYCVASSHNLHELIPAENYFAMRDAVHDYRA
jgi:uroporphyrinogen decarboxylase